MLIAAGGYKPADAESLLERGDADAVAFGRLFIANPDLPRRIALDAKLNAYDRSTFYTRETKGYTDYPSLEQQEAANRQDVVAVRKVFELLSEEILLAKGRLQVIVLDHADENVWGNLQGIQLTEEWRNKALIPREWMDSTASEGNQSS